MDLYLRADTEAEMNATLIAAGMAYETEDGLFPAEGVCLDIIGEIPGAEGWHVNVRCGDLTEEQEAELAFAMITPPETPYRVWA